MKKYFLISLLVVLVAFVGGFLWYQQKNGKACGSQASSSALQAVKKDGNK